MVLNSASHKKSYFIKGMTHCYNDMASLSFPFPRLTFQPRCQLSSSWLSAWSSSLSSSSRVSSPENARTASRFRVKWLTTSTSAERSVWRTPTATRSLSSRRPTTASCTGTAPSLTSLAPIAWPERETVQRRKSNAGWPEDAQDRRWPPTPPSRQKTASSSARRCRCATGSRLMRRSASALPTPTAPAWRAATAALPATQNVTSPPKVKRNESTKDLQVECKLMWLNFSSPLDVLEDIKGF